MAVFTKVEQMTVGIFESNAALGRAAAHDFAEIVKQVAKEHGEVSVILATGNSQLSFMRALREIHDIPWQHIRVFHMDEYLGMDETHTASFRRYLHEHITDIFHPIVTYGIEGDAEDVAAEITRYEALMEEYPPVLCVMGIGENGHLAFNDPPADFNSPKTMHVVDLDETCRNQQVGEGHFTHIQQVPTQALSLTVPALLNPKQVMVLVPEARKAKIVKTSLEGPITEACPASILRTQTHVKLYLDHESSALLS
jgi:glucosamine-6-phosphate deaminase